MLTHSKGKQVDKPARSMQPQWGWLEWRQRTQLSCQYNVGKCEMLEWFGFLDVLLPMAGIELIVGLAAWWQSARGPHQRLADILFHMLVVNALALPLLAFWSSHFWPTLIIYTLLYVLSFAVMAKLLGKLLKDKTGFGAVMFPAWIAMMAFTAAAMARGIFHLYQWLAH